MSTTPPTDLRSLLAALRALAEPIAERLDVDVVAIEVTGSSSYGSRVLRVSLDKVGGSTITDCTRFSRIFSPALDVADVIAAAYTLEVSTPGIERPVQRLVDFERFVGCPCRLKTWDMDSRRRLKCIIGGVDGDEVRLLVEGVERRIHIDDIERANLLLDLDQYELLGQGLHPMAQPAKTAEPVALHKPGQPAAKAKKSKAISIDEGGRKPPKSKSSRKTPSTVQESS